MSAQIDEDNVKYNSETNNEEQKAKRRRLKQTSRDDEKESPSILLNTATDDESYLKLPDELKGVDFTKRISWGKYSPYVSQLPIPTISSKGYEPEPLDKNVPLRLDVHNVCGRARACTLVLPHGPVRTPVYMPVGTKGTVKGISTKELMEEANLNHGIILANTYHLASAPGTELIAEMNGLHDFMNWPRNILTDSGGFQMVSLLKLAEITEEGVTFAHPETGKRMLLKPEDSIAHQNRIGADIIMALDDVVSSVTDDSKRFKIATYRTLRWLDRCYEAHANPTTQNLFPIVQGGLDTSVGGLREQCLAGFRNRDEKVRGYAIGGLAGGESKDDFWRVVDQCCRALPDNKPRYLMGVGYPLDLVVCTALGVDMYDCVYPTRTARFGVALVPGGTLRLKSNEFASDSSPIQDGCPCCACSNGPSGLGYSRARINELLQRNVPLAAQLMTHHNLTYMMSLTTQMRNAIIENKYPQFVMKFIKEMFFDKNEECPAWVINALVAAGIHLEIH